MTDFTQIAICIVISIAGLIGFRSYSKSLENSSATLRTRKKDLEVELELIVKQRDKWRTRYFNLERQVEEGIEIEGDMTTEEGIFSIVKEFLPAIAEKVPQAKGFLDNPELIDMIGHFVLKNPKMASKFAGALLKKEQKKDAKTKEQEAKSEDQKQLTDLNIVG